MFDALTLAAITDELTRTILPGRVQRVLLLDDLSLGLEVYAGHRRHQLLLSAHPQTARLHLVNARLTPDRERVTPFLLLLRKYVRGGQVLDIAQPPLERVVAVSIAKHLPLDKARRPSDSVSSSLTPGLSQGERAQDGVSLLNLTPATAEDEDEDQDDDDEYPGYDVTVRLIVEIMGRHSNIILVDSGGAILDSIKRVPASLNRYRTILPHQPYLPPPDQPKADPRAVDPAWWAGLRARISPTASLATTLVGELRGISPQVARELAYRATGNVDAPVGAVPDDAAVPTALADLLAHLDRHDWAPCLYRRDGQPVAFSPFPLHSLSPLPEGEGRGAGLTEEPFPTISAAAEAFYSVTRSVTGHSQSKARLTALLADERAKIIARRRALDEQLHAATEAETHRQAGELIYAYLHTLQPGQTRLEVDGVTIALDPRQSPVENAQSYFERYRRARAAAANLPELVEAAELELAYLDQLLAFANLAEGLDEIQAIEAEWQERQQAQDAAAGRRKKPAASRGPRRLRTVRGDIILIGRNGRQNDQVTFDLAGPDDLWLHARGLPGAHVILQWRAVPSPRAARSASPSLPEGEGRGEGDDRFVEAAAQLAAYYSPARTATAVEVDLTDRRWVRKIKGGPPGLVTYRNERTVRVAPASEADLRARGILTTEARR